MLRRPGSSRITPRRHASVPLDQLAISSPVRAQPRHRPDAASISQTLMHGLTMRFTGTKVMKLSSTSAEFSR